MTEKVEKKETERERMMRNACRVRSDETKTTVFIVLTISLGLQIFIQSHSNVLSCLVAFYIF